MRWTMTSISIVLLLGGCIQDLLADGAALAPDTETDASSTSTGEPPTPTTSADPGVQTATGVDESTETSATTGDPGTSADPASSSGEEANLPPTVDITVMPGHLSEAGPAKLQLVVSDDVVKVRLSLDGEKLADLTPANFPYAWEALSAKDNGPARKFSVVVEDEEGLTADDETELSVQLPESGAERCLFEDPDKGDVTSIISALRYTPEAIVAVGTRGTGTALRITMWKLDPNNCQPLPGWPKIIAQWTGDEALEGLLSLGVAIDIDEDGNLVVAGNFIVNGQVQSYVALLNSAGSRLWEYVGQPGDEVAGVAASTGIYGNRVFVVGSRRTSDNPVRTDGMVWVYQATDGEVYVQPPTILKAPFMPGEFDQDLINERSEWARAVMIDEASGTALIVGEREFMDEFNVVYTRAFAVRVHPFGDLIGSPWTSTAPAFGDDALNSVATCGDQLLAGGWTRDHADMNATPQPIIFWLEVPEHRHLPQLGSTELYGIACDREAKIVSAATRMSGSTDAQVFSVTGKSDQPIWYEQGGAGANAARGVDCDWRGFCGWGGYRTANAQPYAVVRVHHP